MRLPEIQLHFPNPGAQFVHVTVKAASGMFIKLRKMVVGYASFPASAAASADGGRVDVPVELMNFLGKSAGRVVLRMRLQVHSAFIYLYWVGKGLRDVWMSFVLAVWMHLRSGVSSWRTG